MSIQRPENDRLARHMTKLAANHHSAFVAMIDGAREFGFHARRFPVISNLFPDTPSKDR